MGPGPAGSASSPRECAAIAAGSPTPGDLASAGLPRAGAPVRLADIDPAGGRRGCAAAAARASDRASLRSCQGGDEGPPPFWRDTDLKLHLRSYYFNRENPEGPENEAWAFGGWLSYKSGWLFDVFGIGATFYGSAPLYAPDDKDGTLLLKPGQEGYSVIGESFAAAPVPGLRAREGLPAAGRPALHQPH